MDIVTQGLLGGVMAQTAARAEEKKLATVIGFLAGLLADADVLIQSASDPLLSIEYHRHFTHALMFIPFGALIAALILFVPLRKKITFTRLYLFCFLGYSLSGVLDACTSYGTLLLWPFSDERIAWNIVSIVDPLFSFVLLATMVITFISGRRQLALLGIALASLYLGVAYVQQQRAHVEITGLLKQRQHDPEKLVIKPTLGNVLLWRSVYIHQDTIYIDAVRAGLFAENRIYPGASVQRLDTELFAKNYGAQQYRDIKRFERFSDGYIAFSPLNRNVIGDMRYSMLPTSSRPLWGIVITPELPERPVEYRFFRQQSKQERSAFFAMLLGRIPD